MQKVVEDTKKVFDEKGEVNFGGWSRSPLFEYNKDAYQAQSKLQEKDCYYISSNDMGFYISVETQGSELAICLALADFKTGDTAKDFINRKLLLDPQRLPESGSLGEFSYKDKSIALTLTNTVEGRYIKCDFIDFDNYKNLYVKVLVKKQDGESMNVVAPFEKFPKCFYLKRFVPKFTATGVVRLGGTDYNLDESNSFVYFDWSRYCLPRHQKFQAMSGISEVGGRRFAINLASKVGNNKNGSENCFFIDNKLYKIGRIKVGGDEKDLTKHWFFRTADGSVNLTFTPDARDNKPVLCKCDRLTILFGKLNGELTVPDSGQFTIKDKNAHMIFNTL